VGLKAAKRITELTRELGIKISRQLLIINRSKKLGANLGVEDLNLTYLGSIDSDEEIELNSLNGGSLMNLSENNRSIAALRKLGEEIWHFN
jgi:CO dehydrogenase nickel-insertion accessory protein CooC1